MKRAKRIIIAILVLTCAACKDSSDESKADTAQKKQGAMVALETDLPPAKYDRTQKPRQKSGEKILVPLGTRLLSRGVEVASSDATPIIGELERITDGNVESPTETYYVELLEGLQWVQLDLGQAYSLYAILVWHNYSPRSNDFDYGNDYVVGLPALYHDVVVQISDDPTFNKNVTTVYNNDEDNSSGLGKGNSDIYIETSEGLWIDSKGVKGRYVRLYSNGNTRLLPSGKKHDTSDSKYNHYIEVEVYGK